MTNPYSNMLDRSRESPDYWSTAAIIEFTKRLEDLMAERGMSKSELAIAIGSSPSYITKVLGGDANFTIGTMSKLLNPFGEVLHVCSAPRGWDIIVETRRSVADAEFVQRVPIEMKQYRGSLQVVATAGSTG